jgi:hypothetical protein
MKGTTDYGVLYKNEEDEELTAYTDNDYAGDLEDMKSRSGYVFKMSSRAMSWSSRKQPVVTLSTIKVEFVAAASCACQAVWLRGILEKLKHIQTKSIIVYCDNNSAIKLSKNPVMYGRRSKHIDVRFHFLRELTKAGTIKMIHCGTQDQIADGMTKPLKLNVFLKLRGLMRVCPEPNIN